MNRTRTLLFLISGLVPALLSAQDAEQRFHALDENGDGRVSPAELPRPILFKRLDADNDGFISKAEALAFKPAGQGEKAEPGKPITAEIPDDAPVTLESCEAAANYSAQHNGHAVLVSWKGKTIYERYDNGWTHDKPHRLASGTKSFSGVMLAAAIEDELIGGFDEPVGQTITEWKDDPLRSKITFRQLLSLNSGIDPGDNGKVPAYVDSVAAKGEVKPGKRFAYGPNAFQIFGEAMQRKLAEQGEHADPLAYLEARIFKSIGLEHGPWRRDEHGKPNLPSGCFITAREWVKFGTLLIDQGRHEDRQLLDPELLAELIKPSATNRAYGITFWLGEDVIQAAGAGKQRLQILPKHDLVVVRFGESKAAYQDKQFLARLIPES